MPRPRTSFDNFFDEQMKDPEFAAEYTAARAEIDSVDEVVRALDSLREEQGVTKAELAKRVHMKPEVVRRLFTAEGANPTLETVVKVARALNVRVAFLPRRTGKARAKSARG